MKVGEKWISRQELSRPDKYINPTICTITEITWAESLRDNIIYAESRMGAGYQTRTVFLNKWAFYE